MRLEEYKEFPKKLRVIGDNEPFRFPFMAGSLVLLSDAVDIKSAKEAYDKNELLLLCPKKENKGEKTTYESLYNVGIVCSIVRIINQSDEKFSMIIECYRRAKMSYKIEDTFLSAFVHIIETKQDKIDENTLKVFSTILKERIDLLIKLGFKIDNTLVKHYSSYDKDELIDRLCHTLKLSNEDTYNIYAKEDTTQRLELFILFLNDLIESTQLADKIKARVNLSISQANHKLFLQKMIQEIKLELGEDEDENSVKKYRKKLKKKKHLIAKDALKDISKEINRLDGMRTDSSEAALIETYLEYALNFPFGKISQKELKISKIQTQLDKDHYSLEEPKERVIEYFAVRELLEKRKVKLEQKRGAILCFYGPPGVGKTSLAQSIAKALKRPYFRIALGGLEDVSELRGHRKTFIGAMPGKIVQGMINKKSMDPVIVLDEIDKVGSGARTNPAAVLLEILDPEQNNKFRDNYLNFNIDLSKVIFIATANDLGNISGPLRDRMEIIHISAYTQQEKFVIANKHIIPQEIKKHGLKEEELKIPKISLEVLIQNYTREAGVRRLRENIASVCRKTAEQILNDTKDPFICNTLDTKKIKEYFGNTIFEIGKKDKLPMVGVVNGLAWSPVGGNILKIEVLKTQGKGSIKLTGSLGSVIQESANIALSIVKEIINTQELKIAKDAQEFIVENVYENYNLHIHFPDGSTKKDGPSAGIALVSVIASIFSDRKIPSNIAMTGEVSLSGKVLAIGGLKEKLIAAYSAGIEKVLIPSENYRRDLEDIPDEVKENMEIISVENVKEVLTHTLL